MATELGKLVAIAFNAVKQCHVDAGKLLRDLEGGMNKAGWVRLPTSRDAVTHGVSKKLADAERWMPRLVYRPFKNQQLPNTVDGLHIHFLGHPVVQEPLLIVGRGQYRVAPVEREWRRWDLYNAFFLWRAATAGDLGKVLTTENQDNGRVVRMDVVGVDLFSVKTVREVADLFEKVGNRELAGV